jgi:serine/threonine protein phosphatase PrpC
MSEFPVDDQAGSCTVTTTATSVDDTVSSGSELNKSPKNYIMAVAHEEMNPRRRSTMEDVHRIISNLLNDEHETYSFFGVYDGHGGRQIAEYLEHSLEENVAAELKRTDEASVSEKLTSAFLITDMASKQLNITTSGATAVVALISNVNENDRRLYVANVGDSRAVLACQVSDERCGT